MVNSVSGLKTRLLVDLSFDLPLDSALFRAVGAVAAAFYEQRFTLTCWAGTKFCYGCATSPAKRPIGECGDEIVGEKNVYPWAM